MKLETVDLSKVEGYEEAVKLVEDMKDDMGMKENIKDIILFSYFNLFCYTTNERGVLWQKTNKH